MPTFLHHHLHHGHPDEFTQILRSRNLRAFAFGIARVFIPLFLIVTYGDLESALWPITVFILGAYGVRILMMPAFANFIIHWGAKHAMAASFVAGALSMVMTAYLQADLWFVFGLGLLLGVANGLFFPAYHVDLALTLNRLSAAKRGIGTVEMVRKIVLALGPLIGGIIATQISEKALFLLAAAFMAMATSALYFRDDDVVSHKAKLNLFKNKIYRQHWREFLANFGMGINSTAAFFLWSILLFVVLDAYDAVGFVVAVSLVLSLLIISFIRRRESRSSDHREIAGGSSATSAIHAMRPFVDSAGAAAGVNFFNDIAFSFLYVPYIDRYYKRVRKKDGITFVTIMEMFNTLGATVFWFIFVGLFAVFGQTVAFVGAFFAAAIAAFLLRLISKKVQ